MTLPNSERERALVETLLDLAERYYPDDKDDKWRAAQRSMWSREPATHLLVARAISFYVQHQIDHPQCDDRDSKGRGTVHLNGMLEILKPFVDAQRQAVAREIADECDKLTHPHPTGAWRQAGHEMARRIRSRFLPTEPPDQCPHGNPGNYPDCCYPTEPGGDERG